MTSNTDIVEQGLTNKNDLDNILNKYFNEDLFEVGDELSLRRPVCIFDRLDDINTPVGHWNLLIELDPNIIYLYDPFGVPFYDPLFKNKIVIYSLDQDQRISSNSCGLYCIKKIFEVLFNRRLASNYLIVDYNDDSYEVHIEDSYSLNRFNDYLQKYKLIHDNMSNITYK